LHRYARYEKQQAEHSEFLQVHTLPRDFPSWPDALSQVHAFFLPQNACGPVAVFATRFFQALSFHFHGGILKIDPGIMPKE